MAQVSTEQQPTVKFVKVFKHAFLPTRAHNTDIGYDLAVIDVYKNISSDTLIFETGIAVQPPEGYYIEILPRSSVTFSPYMLANSVGVIDPGYTGTLKIAVRKVDYNLEEPNVPFTKFQMVLRRAIPYNLEEVRSIESTDRGNGGFGSSG